MNCSANRDLTNVVIMLSCTIFMGCQGGSPATNQSKTSSPPEATTSETGKTTPIKVVDDGPPFELEPDFRLLALEQFDSFAAESDTWKATSDGIACTGKPRGYLYSKQPYQNFTLRLDYRFPRPDSLKDESKFKGNTGFLVYITGPHKLWPMCLEVQGKHIQMAAIKENGGAQPVVAQDDDVARQAARKPVGQWNAIEVVSKNGELRVSLNGTSISKSEPDFLSEGSIGIQAEDFPFEIRRMRIRLE